MPQEGPGDGEELASTPSGPAAGGSGADPATPLVDEHTTLEMPEGLRSLGPRQVLGERYQTLELLGRGGMGEVWQAFDLKLRVEVALKALRGDLLKSTRRLELLRQEVRAAREVVSPNVCRIFDLIEIEGRELVSMEYVDGQTLLAVLQERGPLELKEAQDIASQFLAGLEAIHKAGLIHRDIKPENIMLTRAGRVVVMDFGVARQEGEGGGSVSGTPAYMAPEQAAGQALDARADVYSAGVVLAEMVSPDGIKSFESRQSLWEGVRSEPAEVPDSPWAPVIRQAVAREREQRYHSAHTLTRALEHVTLRVEGAEDLHPYPGLASFTEADAEYFFGREAEVEQMWRRLGQLHLLALVGPSGAGKTSFLRAGLVPSAPPGWGVVRCTPGNGPLAGLREALVPGLSGDTEAMRELVRGEDPDAMVSAVSRWRRRHEQALLIIDQFEELFTLNPPEMQERFARLLGRLALDADVRVLLSMRDDFLFHCQKHGSLKPVFSELTPLGAPIGAALRRALVQPATKCGYRFEDDELVDEMLAEVESERGALPLLAFAAARLWEGRDRENGLLTRQAYHDIGGVGGALARHAEQAMERIGAERHDVVRELFGNLITAQGTRAARDYKELLSVFDEGQRGAAEQVLGQLIDARLLTSYEVVAEGREPWRRVEIIHESLLERWPRLRGWRTQDADSIRLRDQLRQAAQTWDERGRPDDLLWAGSAFREYLVWRDRYPGGLTDFEAAFARAMTRLASRTRRRRRLVVTAAFVVVLAAAAALGALWRRSTHAARRAEAQKLVALGRLALDTSPAEALALARASLGLDDTAEARRLALETLWRRGAVRVLAADGAELRGAPALSPDGQWLAASDLSGRVSIRHQGGGGPAALEMGSEGYWLTTFDPSSSWLAVWPWAGGTLRLLSPPGWETVRSLEAAPATRAFLSETSLITATPDGDDPPRRTFTSYPIGGGPPKSLGALRLDGTGFHLIDLDASSGRVAFVRGRSLFVRHVEDLEGGSERLVGTHADEIDFVLIERATGDRIVSHDGSGRLNVWSFDGRLERALDAIEASAYSVVHLGWRGRRFASSTATGLGAVEIWDLDGPPGALPARVTPGAGLEGITGLALDPPGRWVATTRPTAIRFWPLTWPRYHVIPNPRAVVASAGFTPDGTRLVLRSLEEVIVVPLVPGIGSRSASRAAGRGYRCAIHPSGTRIATTGSRALVTLPLDGTEVGEPLEVVPSGGASRVGAAYDPTGRLLATATAGADSPERQLLQVLDLETGERTELPLAAGAAEETFDRSDGGIATLHFAADGTLYSGGDGGIRRWDLTTGSSELVLACEEWCWMFPSGDGKQALVASGEPWSEATGLLTIDLETGATRTVRSHGDRFKSFAAAMDPSGRAIVTGRADGVRVGPSDGGEPHLLLGHEEPVTAVAVSPDGRWIASVGGSEIRLWAMPDVSRPPLHTLPHDELLAKLDALTNLRAVRDPESATGWTLEAGPFPGWAEVPEW